MDDASIWITPLALLPGVALLVMSTAVRFGQVHEEIHRHLAAHEEHRHDKSEHLVTRAAMFRNALVAQYASIALLAVAGLVGGLAMLWVGNAREIVLALTAAAVGMVAYSATTLIRESTLLMRVIEAHGEDLRRQHTD